MTTEEAQKHGNFAPWADHRAFMEQDFVRVLDLAARITHEIDSGAPVDRSVVRVEVLDPSGKLVRAYSSNVTILDGRAAFHIPFALNDPKGRWTVKSRDVVSGLTAVGRCSPRTEP